MQKPAETNSPVLDEIRERWSPRAFSSAVIERSKINSLLEAWRWAPSAGNQQAWKIILAEKTDPVSFDLLISVLEPSNARWATAAPLLMLSIARTVRERDGKTHSHAFHDVGLATGNLMIEATRLGLRVHAMAGFDSDKARAVFHIPAEWSPVTAIAIGYPGDPDSLPEDLRTRELAPRSRRPIAEIVLRGGFDEPHPGFQEVGNW